MAKFYARKSSGYITIFDGKTHFPVATVPVKGAAEKLEGHVFWSEDKKGQVLIKKGVPSSSLDDLLSASPD